MWIEVYLVVAVIAAVTVWLVSRRLQSYQPPSGIARSFWALAAGALWPVTLLGVAELLAVLFLTQRLRSATADDPDFLPPASVDETRTARAELDRFHDHLGDDLAV